MNLNSFNIKLILKKEVMILIKKVVCIPMCSLFSISYCWSFESNCKRHKYVYWNVNDIEKNCGHLILFVVHLITLDTSLIDSLDELSLSVCVYNATNIPSVIYSRLLLSEI